MNVSVTLEAAQTQPEEKSAVQATAMCGWIIKGLAMRGYKHLEKWIDKVCFLNTDLFSFWGVYQVLM